MIGLILLLIVVFIFAYLLFAPFYVEINSEDAVCRIRFYLLANAGLVVRNNSLILDLKIAGWQKKVDLLAARTQTKKPPQKKETAPKKRVRIPYRKVRAVVSSFRIKKCDLSFDFCDMPLNGILYPLFKWLSLRTGKSIRINFSNENKIILELENNFAHIIWAFFKSSFTNH